MKFLTMLVLFELIILALVNISLIYFTYYKTFLINQIILIMSILTPAMIFITWYLSKSFVKPIHEMRKATEEVEKGNFDIRVNIKTGDEMEQLGNAFNKTTESLGRIDDEKKQIDKAKTEFLSITSHELRSPMTPMKAQLQMLMENYFGKLNEKQREAVDIVLRNTDRLDVIIQDFLEISRIEAARLKFTFIKTSLVPYIDEVIEEMKVLMPAKGIEIVAKIDKLPVIEVDPDRVMQILRNLVNNAMKFSEKNSKVIVSAKLEGDMILFSVKDFGIGIAKENQVRIFEPFFQEEQTMYRKYGGTGLGLAICKGITESQNGKIWFESERGKGSTFYFTIPLIPVREMKPIKLLFSNKESTENAVKKFLIEILGPLGETEFEELKRHGLSEEKAIDYIQSLNKEGIISVDLEKIKNSIKAIFNEGKKENET